MSEEKRIELKKYFRKSFSKANQVSYWHEVYTRQDFIGLCFRERINTALDWIDKSNLSLNSKILDVGCGTGLFVNEIFRRGYKAFGIDYSFEMLESSKNICSIQLDKRAILSQADLESLPFKNSSFDVVVCLGVVAYLLDLDKAFKELVRILKSDGILMLSIVNKARLINRMDIPLLFKNQVQKMILKYKLPFYKVSEETENRLTRKTYSIPYIINVMRRYNFVVSEYKTVPLGLLTFLGKEIAPKNLNVTITMFFEQYTNIPVIGSFGGMVLFKAKKMPKEK